MTPAPTNPLSATARHAILTADHLGCLMPSYCGSPVADELRAYGLSSAATDERWRGWEQLTAAGYVVRALLGDLDRLTAALAEAEAESAKL